MRKIVIALAAIGAWLTVSASYSAVPANSNDPAVIRALEEEWERALLAADYRALERMLAPEFKLMVAGQRRPGFTPRAEWFANLRNFRIEEYETEVVDVVMAGNTAVATVQGSWKVVAGQSRRENRFILSDTWVKRHGRWTVVYRHATNLPTDSPSAGAR
jgi:ketosteroid isomerase-like protein